MEEKIRETFLSLYKDKIKENESYKEYMSSYNKDQIERLFKIYAVIMNDNKELSKFTTLFSKTKKNIIKELDLNKKKIYTTLIKCIDENIYSQLIFYLERYKGNIIEVKSNQLRVSLHFIEFLTTNCLAKVKYSKNKKIITFYTPKELREDLKSILKNRKLKKLTKINGVIKENLHNIISAYGVIPVKRLNKIYDKTYGKIDYNFLIDKILINCLFDDDIRLTLVDDDYYAYGVTFENEDECLEFYYSLPEKLDYKVYKKKEYSQIGSGTYHRNTKEWEGLKNYLQEKYEMDDNDIINFDEEIVLDYLFSYQVDVKEAKKNLKNNIGLLFENFKPKDRTYITKSIEEISKNYPNYNYKGYSFNEINDKKNS